MRRVVEAGSWSGRVVGLALIAMASLGGCISADNALGLQSSGRPETYLSTPGVPQSIAVVDTRTGETVWAMDIPVGQQLTLHFRDVGKRSNELGYDEMEWQLNAIGSPSRTLSNAMRVPPAYARRIDGSVRQPEFGPVVSDASRPQPAAPAPSAPTSMPWQAPPTIDLPDAESPASK